MILSGPAIRAEVAAGRIVIDPFNLDQLNPASYDLTLGDMGCVYTQAKQPDVPLVERDSGVLPDAPWGLDSKRNNHSYRFLLPTEGGFRVRGPANTVHSNKSRVLLLHVRERICTRGFVPVLDGKSSLGRLGLVVHATAGYGDPGFDGQFTLEVFALGEDVIVYPGMRIAQLRFHALDDNVAIPPDYAARGHYVGPEARGPVPSKSYLQFRDTEPPPAASLPDEPWRFPCKE